MGTLTEAKFLVRRLSCIKLISSLSPNVKKLFRGILSWAQTLILVLHRPCPSQLRLVSNSFTNDQEYQKTPYLSHPQLKSSSFISHSQMTNNLAYLSSLETKICKSGRSLPERNTLIASPVRPLP
jgi:hypothetical protein